MDTVQMFCPQGQSDLDDAIYSEYFCCALQDTKYERELHYGHVLPWATSSTSPASTLESSPTISQTISEPSSSFTTSSFNSRASFPSISPADLNQSQLLGLNHLSVSPFLGFIDTSSSVPPFLSLDDHIQGKNLGINHAAIDFGIGSSTPYLNAESGFIFSPEASVALQSDPLLSWSNSSPYALLQPRSDFSQLLSPPADELDQASESIQSDQDMGSQEVVLDMPSDTLDMSENTYRFHQEQRQHGCPSAVKHARQRNRHADAFFGTMTPDCEKSVRRHSTSSITRKSYPCRYGDCGNSFSRQADLDRHIDHVHTEDGQKPRFECDYAKCPRATTPFYRKDHFRDHLRDQHREDIPKRGSNANHTVPRDHGGLGGEAVYKESHDELLVQEVTQHRELKDAKDCVIQPDWWRCSRCLKRVGIKEHGWTCPTCKGCIEQTRHKSRTSP